MHETGIELKLGPDVLVLHSLGYDPDTSASDVWTRCGPGSTVFTPVLLLYALRWYMELRGEVLNTKTLTNDLISECSDSAYTDLGRPGNVSHVHRREGSDGDPAGHAYNLPLFSTSVAWTYSITIDLDATPAALLSYSSNMLILQNILTY
ncbi:hypothetical protein CBL_11805 [Carabus blaptoides fortunei]